jgi:AsmA protein
VLSRGDLHIGAAQAAITGSYVQQPEAVFVKLNLAAPGMSVPELAELLPALGIVLPAGSALQGGTASAHLTMDGTLDRLVTTGSIGLSKTRLTGFDLPKKMATIERLAGIKGGPDTEIETLSGNLRLAPEGTAVQEIRLIVPAIGEISGGGNVSPAKALSFKMSALLHTSGIAAVIGREPIPFAIEGTCSEPVFRPDVKGVAAEEVKRIEGGAAKAADGILRGLLDRQKKN